MGAQFQHYLAAAICRPARPKLCIDRLSGLANAATSGGCTSVAGFCSRSIVIFWGVGIWQGTATGGPADHAFRLFRAVP